MFGFKLGLGKYGEKSYLYYNITEKDFPNAHFIAMP